jgi:hypothetical protein
VWHEGRREFEFVPQNFSSFVGVFLVAVIAPNQKWTVQSGWRLESIGLAKSDFVPRINIVVPMSLYVLADHYPAVVGIFPRTPRPHRAFLCSECVVRKRMRRIIAQL